MFLNLKNYIICCLVGVLCWFGYLDWQYRSTLQKIEKEYAESVAKAKEQELKWQAISIESSNAYKKELDKLTQDNATLSSVADGLRKQLTEYSSRVSQSSKPSTGTNARPRDTKLAGKLAELVTFSEQCAKRTDELTIQLKNLQQWTKGVQNGN